MHLVFVFRPYNMEIKRQAKMLMACKRKALIVVRRLTVGPKGHMKPFREYNPECSDGLQLLDFSF